MALSAPTGEEAACYIRFLQQVLPSFMRVTRRLEELQSRVHALWPAYIAPLQSGTLKLQDAARLWQLFLPHLHRACMSGSSSRYASDPSLHVPGRSGHAGCSYCTMMVLQWSPQIRRNVDKLVMRAAPDAPFCPCQGVGEGGGGGWMGKTPPIPERYSCYTPILPMRQAQADGPPEPGNREGALDTVAVFVDPIPHSHSSSSGADSDKGMCIPVRNDLLCRYAFPHLCA